MAERTERDVLNHLMEICKDGERGFRAAADHVNNAKLKTLFADLSAQRRSFAEELVPHLRRMGSAPEAGGSNAATLHRGWMALVDMVPGRHDHHIVTEAERGERAALDAYDEALNGMLPPTVSDLIEAQREAMAAATDRIRAIDMGYS